MKKKVYAIVGGVMAITLALGCVIVNLGTKKEANASNFESTDYEEMLPIMDEFSKGYAKAYAEEMVENIEFDVSSIPLYNSQNNIVGYSVSLFDNETPYGYVNFDYTTESAIVDFSIDKDTKGMYESLEEDLLENQTNISKDDCTEKIYYNDALNFAISAKQDDSDEEIYYDGSNFYEEEEYLKRQEEIADAYFDYYGNETNSDLETVTAGAKEVKTSGKEDVKTGDNDSNETDNKNSIKQGFIDFVEECFPSIYNKFFSQDGYKVTLKYKDFDSAFKTKEDVMGTIETEKFLDSYSKEKSLIAQKTIMTTTNKFACALVGATEICQQENIMVNNNLKDTFDTLWDIADCDSTVYETCTMYGDCEVKLASTQSENLADIMKEYGNKVGKNITGEFVPAPDFEHYKNCIDNQKPLILHAVILKEGPHAVSTVGYAISKAGKHTVNYLIIADGWNDGAPRYVVHDKFLFDSTACTSFTIE